MYIHRGLFCKEDLGHQKADVRSEAETVFQSVCSAGPAYKSQ